MYLLVRLARLLLLVVIFIILLWALMPNHGSAIVVGWAGGISSELFLNKRVPLVRLKNIK